MGENGSSLDRLAAALREEWWVDGMTVEDGAGHIEVQASEAPDLRAVYDAVGRAGEGAGTVTVDGPSGAWAVDHADGEIRDVRRVGGQYTVHRMSAAERFFHGLAALGAYVILAAVVTAVADFFLTTPLSLLGVGTVAGVAGTLGVGVLLVAVGLVMFVRVPGMTHGETAGEPGIGVEGFDRLTAADRAALIAFDDAKSERVATSLLGRRRTLGLVGAYGFGAYLGLLGWLNGGGAGVLLVCGLYAAWTLFRLAGLRVFVGELEPLEDDYVDQLHGEIREAAGVETSPTIYGYGDPDGPIHGGVAMAFPELDAVLLPLADVARLRRDELKAILAHEHEHVRSHRPLVFAGLRAALVTVPGLALLVTGAAPSALAVGGGLLLYFALLNAGLAVVRRRWEYQADAFAAEVASPLGLAFALTRLTDEPVIDAVDASLLSGPADELYGAHPYPQRRVARAIRAAALEERVPQRPGREPRDRL